MGLPRVLHAVCASREQSARQAVAAALASVAEVEFVDAASVAAALHSADLLISDAAPSSEHVQSRGGAPTTARPRNHAAGGTVPADVTWLAITQQHGARGRDDMLVGLQQGADHVCALLDPADLQAAVTTAVAATSAGFGVARFRRDPAVPIFQRELANAAARDEAVRELVGFCHLRGLRRAALARVQSVVDEVIMNAQLDAPRGASAAAAAVPTVEWFWDDDQLVVAVTDWFGRLEKASVVAAIARAREASGAPNLASVGAGVGLFFVMAHVGRFIVQVQPGERTEVVCMFDVGTQKHLRLGTRIGDGVRAMHFLVTPAVTAAAVP
ncbi:MAG TPA: hypothetical protein PLF40_11240 [Kofleriaceae bacterium]|nr:hypothetical protein [Kofleriaceae bacterium]